MYCVILACDMYTHTYVHNSNFLDKHFQDTRLMTAFDWDMADFKLLENAYFIKIHLTMSVKTDLACTSDFMTLKTDSSVCS